MWGLQQVTGDDGDEQGDHGDHSPTTDHGDHSPTTDHGDHSPFGSGATEDLFHLPTIAQVRVAVAHGGRVVKILLMMDTAKFAIVLVLVVAATRYKVVV